jgi:hypothetical protein
MTQTSAAAWQPFTSAPRDGRWIIARCNDKSALFYISWGRDRKGELSWCTKTRAYGDGLFLPNGDWINAPHPAADGEAIEGRDK